MLLSLKIFVVPGNLLQEIEKIKTENKKTLFSYFPRLKKWGMQDILSANHLRGVAQWLSASALGAESRGFDPRRPDHFFCSTQAVKFLQD